MIRQQKKRQTLLKSYDEVSIASTVKSEKDIKRKENDRPISFMSKDIETIIKIFEFKSIDI